MALGKKILNVTVAGGTGNLGSIITEALLDKGFPVTILTRIGMDDKKPVLAKLTSRGAKIASADYSSKDSLKQALSTCNVLVSTLSGMAVGKEQMALADAAKAAGVNLFIPSEFGIDTSLPANIDGPLIKPKAETAAHCKKIGLPMVRAMSGFFMDTFFLEWFEVDLPGGKARIVGDGKKPFSCTHRRDVGRFVAQIIEDGVKDEVVRLSGQVLTLQEAFATWERVKGKKIAVEAVSIADANKIVAESKDPWVPTMYKLKIAAAEGRALNKENVLQPKGFKPITIEEHFRSL